jgi:cytochrome b561
VAIGWRNSRRRFGWVAMGFHWLMAAAILFTFCLGLYMTSLEVGAEQFELFQLHKSLGVTILLLAVLRVLWRLVNPVPPLPAGMAGWERGLAHVSHYGLYVLMFLVPVIGWCVVSVSPLGLPTFLYNQVEWPHIPFLAAVENKEAAEAGFVQAHLVMAWLLIFLFFLHVAGALKHHFISRDDTLKRMLPTRLSE